MATSSASSSSAPASNAISDPPLKDLPRSERRKIKKKKRKKQMRTHDDDEDEGINAELQSLEEDFLRKQADTERELHHRIWMEREETARRELQAQKEKEAKEAEERQKAADRRKAEAEERKRKREEEKKKQEEEQNRVLKLTTMSETELSELDKTYAKTYGTEKDRIHCSFYLKTGSCRFGAACGRGHPYPPVSNTLMFKNMYIGPGMSEIHEEDAGDDMQHDEPERQTHFEEFFEDVLPEFEKFGAVVNFKVCRNNAVHLRGNVYVQFRELADAVKAFSAFDKRFYGGKQLIPEFVPVTKWKAAICGLFDRNLCPKGKQCNFLHVFRNPGGRFADADRDFQSTSAPSSSSNQKRKDRENDSEGNDSGARRSRYRSGGGDREKERDRERRERDYDRDRDYKDKDAHRERDRDRDNQKDYMDMDGRRERDRDYPRDYKDRDRRERDLKDKDKDRDRENRSDHKDHRDNKSHEKDKDRHYHRDRDHGQSDRR